MRRASLNFTVDAIALVAFVFLAATGLLVRYVIPPGSGHSTTLWGMDRHGWGGLHFWIAVVLLASLALHLFLHWRWVVTMVKGAPREGSGMRVALASVGLLALLGLATLPFLGPLERSAELQRHEESAQHDPGGGAPIDGSMTLGEIELETGVPASLILRELGLPAEAPLDERLGQLRRRYGFEVEAVRDIVDRHTG